MGQQHRVRAKRKRRHAYLERKKEAARKPRSDSRAKKKSAPASAAAE